MDDETLKPGSLDTLWQMKMSSYQRLALYGKDGHGPSGMDYEADAMSDANAYQEWARSKWNGEGINSLYQSSWIEELLNAATGDAGETGELIDLIKKLSFHRLELTPELREKVKLELGDKLYYIATLARLFGYPLSEVMTANQTKLNKRYPVGFDADRSNRRAEFES